MKNIDYYLLDFLYIISEALADLWCISKMSAPGYFVIQKALYFVILRQLAQVLHFQQRDYIMMCTTNLGLSNWWTGKNPSHASLFCHPSWFMDLSLWFSRGALLEKCPYSAVFTPWQNTLTVGDKIDVSLYWQNSRSLTVTLWLPTKNMEKKENWDKLSILHIRI